MKNKAEISERHQMNMGTVWLMLVLPPILLGVLIMSYLVIAQLDPSDPGTEQVVRQGLPYIITVNHLSLFALLLFLLHRQNTRFTDIGWRLESRSAVIEILIGVAGALVLYLFKEFAIDSVRALMAGNRPTFTSLFNFRLGEIYIPMALAATGLVFVEESIYRGLAIPRLMQRFGVVAAVLISSVCFGVLHWGNGPFAVLSTAVLGLLFAGIFLWRDNLVAGTVAHAGYNLLVLAT